MSWLRRGSGRLRVVAPSGPLVHLAQEDDGPERKLVRQTCHVEQRYIEAVKREADRTGESYAAIVNRAFARYFAGR